MREITLSSFTKKANKVWVSHLPKLTQQANDRAESRWVSVPQKPHWVLTIHFLVTAREEEPSLIDTTRRKCILSSCSGQGGSIPGKAGMSSHYVPFLNALLQNAIIITSNRLKLQFMAIWQFYIFSPLTANDLTLRNYPSLFKFL